MTDPAAFPTRISLDEALAIVNLFTRGKAR